LLGALAPHLPPSEQPAVYATALEAARTIQEEGSRAKALALYFSMHQPSRSHWRPTLHILAARGRPFFLRDLAVLMPWLAALATPEELKEIADAIRDVARCWP
jgi:hypothetical protein